MDQFRPDRDARSSSRNGDQSRRFRVCLAASGGGHLRQLLDLEGAWSKHDYFFLTEDTALSRSLAKEHKVRFVPHFAFGQARRSGALRMLIDGVRNACRSAAAIYAERPSVVITTGAGSAFFGALFARLMGAKILAIESFARFEKPSLFGRMIAPFAHVKVVQSQKLLAVWPDAHAFDPVKIDASSRQFDKKPLLFVTVGATFKFDRLVQAVADLKARGQIPEDVVAQVGIGGVAPEGIKTFEELSFEEIKRMLDDAAIVVSHGGSGSLITALRRKCRVVAMPRTVALREAYDDHQFEIAAAFATRGLIEIASSGDDLLQAIERARARPAAQFSFDASALTNFLDGLLRTWSSEVTATKTVSA